MSNQTVAIHIDGVRHSIKPKTNLSKKTSRVQEVTPEQFKNVLTNGMTVCLAEFTTAYPWASEAEFVQQQYFMLDFDNYEVIDKEKVRFTDSRYLSFEEAKNNRFLQENAIFMYKTFSDAEGHDRFRVAFKLDKPMTEVVEALKVNMALLKHFPNADANCKDIKRISFGGKSEHHIFDYNNVLKHASLDTEQLELNQKQVASNSFENSAELTTNSDTHEIVSMIANGEITELQEKLNIEGVVYPSVYVVKAQLKKINLAEVFNVPLGINFCDIFHEESNPSARIYKNDNGEYVYTCFSASNKYAGDIISVIQRIRDCQYHEAIEFLMCMFDITIKVNEDVQRIHNQLDLVIGLLEDVNTLKKEYPDVHKVFINPKNRSYCRQILQLFRNHTFIDYKTGEQQVAITMSVDTIMYMLSCNSRQTINDALIKLRTIGLIKSLDDTEVPQHVLVKMRDSQLKRNIDVGRFTNRTNMHSCSIQNNMLGVISKGCGEYREKRITIATMSNKGIGLALGEEKRKETFVHDQNKQAVSPKVQKQVDSLIKYADKFIEKKGYACDADLINKFNQGFKLGSKAKAKRIYDELRSGMIAQGNFKAIQNNKENRQEHNIQERMQGGHFYIKGEK